MASEDPSLNQRNRKKVNSDGTISWNAMEDAGEVDLDDSISGGRPVISVFNKLNLEGPLDSNKFVGKDFVRRMSSGRELSLEKLQRDGFSRPICVMDKDGLGMKIPPAATFSINDVR